MRRILTAATLAAALASTAGCALQAPPPVSDKVASYYSNPPKATEPAIQPTTVFIGDSYTVGAGSTGEAKGWAYVAARTLDWFPYISADSASGYITPGKRGMTLDELITTAKPEIAPTYVVIASGYNDSASDVPLLSDAINADLDAAKAKWKTAKLIVIGPWAPNGTVNENQTIARDLLKTAAAERKAVFIDPISEGWFKTPDMIGKDGIHPTDAGHRILGENAAAAIKAALKL